MEGTHSQQRAKSGKVSKAFILLLRTHPQCLQVGNFGHFQTSKSTDRGSISKGPSGGATKLFTLEAELGYWWCPKQSNPNFRALKPQVPNNLSPGAAGEGAWDTQPGFLWGHLAPSIQSGPQITWTSPLSGARALTLHPPGPQPFFLQRRPLGAPESSSPGQHRPVRAQSGLRDYRSCLHREGKRELHTKCEF